MSGVTVERLRRWAELCQFAIENDDCRIDALLELGGQIEAALEAETDGCTVAPVSRGVKTSPTNEPEERAA